MPMLNNVMIHIMIHIMTLPRKVMIHIMTMARKGQTAARATVVGLLLSWRAGAGVSIINCHRQEL